MIKHLPLFLFHSYYIQKVKNVNNTPLNLKRWQMNGILFRGIEISMINHLMIFLFHSDYTEQIKNVVYNVCTILKDQSEDLEHIDAYAFDVGCQHLPLHWIPIESEQLDWVHDNDSDFLNSEIG